MSDELRRVLWPKGHRPDIWAIVDAAQDQQIYWTLTNSFLPYCCLFAGPLPEALEMAAPYLVQLDPEDKFTNYLGKNLHRNVAVFLECDKTLAEVRHHLRSFLTVKDPSGRKMLFRYYDPRVLRVYLPTCTTLEMQTVFGPVKRFWAVSGNENELTQFEFRGKDLRVEQQRLGGVELELSAAIVPAQSVLAVPHSSSRQTRSPILLQGAGRGGVLGRSSSSIRFFKTISAPEELPFAGGAYSIPAVPLEPDVTVYAEAASPGEVTLTLETPHGGKAEAGLQAIELFLDGGSAEICVGTTPDTRRRLDVSAKAFTGRLTLRGSKGLSLYLDPAGGEAYALVDGFHFDSPPRSVSFWLEGDAPGPGTVELFVEGSQIAGAIRAVTVVVMAPPESRSVTLLAEEAGALPLTAQMIPSTASARWSVERRDDDGEAVRKKSKRPLPTLSGGTLVPDAVGSFLLRAKADDSGAEWGGPSVTLEVNVVHAEVVENRSSINGRFCSCARAPETQQFRLDCGNGGVNFEVEITLTGGGPEGRRGVEAIRAGWIHQVVSDNSGARYKGGVTRQAAEPFSLETATTTSWTPMALAAPSSSWPAQDGGVIEQIWRYLEVASHLALWSTDTPERRGSLLRMGWSFTADYACNATKTTRAIVPARLASTGTVVFPGLTNIEELHDRQED
jgi:hypothetical protein